MAAPRRAAEVSSVRGGRVLSVTALGDSLNEARDAAYRAVSMIEFEGMHYRRDIGLRAISEGANSSGVVS